jgi:hypothetical protein
MKECGLSEQEAYSRFWLVDKDGLLGACQSLSVRRKKVTTDAESAGVGRKNPQPQQMPFVRRDLKDGLSLYETVKQVPFFFSMSSVSFPTLFAPFFD